jgi:hypothetical protein
MFAFGGKADIGQAIISGLYERHGTHLCAHALNQHHQFEGAKHMTALQGWIVIGLLVLIMLGIVGIGAEIKELPYLWRTDAPNAASER